MHSYLRSVGFSTIKKDQLDKFLYEAIRRPDRHEVALDSEGNEYVELDFEVCKNIGIGIRGIYDLDDNFKIDYYFPYCVSESMSTVAYVDVIKQSDRESYQGFCDDVRLGVNVIFYLQNAIEYLQRKSLDFQETEKPVFMTGLSLEGKVLLPVVNANDIENDESNTLKRNSMIAAAREGDEEAIESLTIEDIDTYSMISRRVQNEDIYSIVSTSFMPYGIESDKFLVIAEIKDFRKVTNYVTMEELYVMQLETNEVMFDLCINTKDLLGEPEIGRRFKGVVWLQGYVQF